MPKDRRRRTFSGLHQSSARVASRQSAVPDNAAEKMEIVGMSDIVAPEVESTSKEDVAEASFIVPTMKKKEKQQMKRDVFRQSLETAAAPYSKSHSRRLKRKSREELGTDLGDMRSVLLATVGPESATSITTGSRGSKNEGSGAGMAVDGEKPEQIKPKIKPGQIGQGKGATLSQKERKRALELERLRQPLIAATAAFSQNPFATIRTHAQNTLVMTEREERPATQRT